MSSPFLTALEAEIAEIEGELENDPRYIKLRELKRLQSLYVHSANTELYSAISRTMKQVSRAVAASRESKNQDKIDAAVRFLEGRTVPVPTAVLLDHLQNQGLEIRGQEPRNTLSAILSHSTLFAAQGRSGWLLRSALEQKPDDAYIIGPTAPDMFQGQNDETPSGYQPLGASEPGEEDEESV